MTLSHQIEPVVDRLQSALDGKLFPNEWHQWGSQLLDHLRKPVQVAVMGMAGTGKSTLINMMLGQNAIPRIDGVSVIEIAHGMKPRAMFELEDGSSVRRSGGLADLDIPRDAVRARVELCDPALMRQNYIEVGLSGNFGHQVSMVNWVVQWADIILWCTESFDEDEQKLWAGVPDDIKDHSFLVLTMADRQMMRGVLQDRIAALEPVVSEEFMCLYPIATEQAITARMAGDQINQALWKSSGGKQLLDGVMRQVDNGRTADVDQAQMLLNRFVPEQMLTAAVVPVAAPEPAAETAPARRGNDEILTGALQMLQDCANEMLAGFADKSEPRPERILERCIAAAEQLSDVLQHVDADDLVAREIQSDAQESAEMMLLFQLEKDEDAAVDAVTLLLQLKKEIAHKTDAACGEQ